MVRRAKGSVVIYTDKNGGSDLGDLNSPSGRIWRDPRVEIEQFKGLVVEKLFAEGSKSEHRAVMLQTESGEYKLRRPGGNPFYDSELVKYVGKSVSLEGRVIGGSTIMIKPDSIVELESD